MTTLSSKEFEVQPPYPGGGMAYVNKFTLELPYQRDTLLVVIQIQLSLASDDLNLRPFESLPV